MRRSPSTAPTSSRGSAPRRCACARWRFNCAAACGWAPRDGRSATSSTSVSAAPTSDPRWCAKRSPARAPRPAMASTSPSCPMSIRNISPVRSPASTRQPHCSSSPPRPSRPSRRSRMHRRPANGLRRTWAAARRWRSTSLPSAPTSTPRARSASRAATCCRCGTGWAVGSPSGPRQVSRSRSAAAGTPSRSCSPARRAWTLTSGTRRSNAICRCCWD